MPLQPKQQPPYYENLAQTKKYIAILNQTGTDAPIPIIQQNTLGETITWTRQTTGEYRATKPTDWNRDKTTILITCGSDPFVIQTDIHAGGDYITIYGFDNTWTAMDSIVEATIEITTY